jgi:hypothetical protein
MRPELLFAFGIVIAVALLPAVRLLTGRLPVAPACPACRAVTAEGGGSWPFERALTQLSMTSLRSCARCGWNGRMRWRLAADRAAKDRRGSG